MTDVELKGNFSDLDWDAIDLAKSDWSWGFALDRDGGEIRHCVYEEENKRFVTTRYQLPRFIAEIVIQSRIGAVDRLRSQLLKLKEQESRLLSGKDD